MGERGRHEFELGRAGPARPGAAGQGVARQGFVRTEIERHPTMQTYRVTITGTQPLLMHADDIEWADEMERWKLDKDNKKVSKAGDDRTPAHRWIGALYRNEAGEVILPTENLMRCLMEGGAMVLVPGGRSGKTFKAQTQSGIMPRSMGWPLLVNGKSIDAQPIIGLLEEKDFGVHKETVEKLGFSLFVKRARIGQSKHVRVRPRFDSWQAGGELTVTDEQITEEVLNDVFEMAGTYKGLGDWRPSSPKAPGVFGMFTASVQLVN